MTLKIDCENRNQRASLRQASLEKVVKNSVMHLNHCLITVNFRKLKAPLIF